MYWLRNESSKIDLHQYKKHFLEHLDCHESAGWIKRKELFLQMSTIDGNLPMETMVEEVMLAVTE